MLRYAYQQHDCRVPLVFFQSITRVRLLETTAIAGIDDQAAAIAEQQSRCTGWTVGR